MAFEVKSTNLSLLREIIDGNYDEILQEYNENVVITNDFVNLLKEYKCVSNKRKKNRKKNCSSKEDEIKTQKLNCEYHLCEDREAIRHWLREKKILAQKRKVFERKQKKEESLKLKVQEKEKLERKALGRAAYDQWLKYNRKANKSSLQIHELGDHCLQKCKSDEASEAYNLWLQKKTKEKDATKSDSFPPAINSKPVKIPSIRSTSNHVVISNQISPIIKHKTSNRLSTNSEKPFEKELSNDNVDENMKRIISNLRKKKYEETEKSKKRVDCGVFLHREKIHKKESNQSSDAFLWRLETDNEQAEEISYGKGNSRSRRVDLISHKHDNPFVEVS